MTSGTVDLNPGLTYDMNSSMVAIPSDGDGPSTSNSVVLADGSNMQVAKFNGKSNTNDLTKLSSQ